ncbi:MAG: PGF-pre-PGF domain-containing protein [Methanomethylovorans sp.]|uniref:PGF-pre-PGF domain-containing protein n=1 Tax=Methanomethylovorans sp. TaxID=2758717 RepID=UPI003531725C
MQLKLSGPICFGLALFCMIIIAGIGSAEELNVNFAGQFDENTYDAAVITNALLTDGQDITSHFGGSISSVVVVGNYAYLAQGQDMLVIDIADPSIPSSVGSVTTPALINNIAVAGNYAYIADGENGLVIVDITNKATPTIRGTYATDSAYGVAVAENYAYVADGDSGLIIVDISNPDAPNLKGTRNTDGHSASVTLSGNHAYVADGVDGLVVIDITNPANPTIAGTCDTNGNAVDVAISGNYTYVADESNGLVVIDTINPANPTIAGNVNTGDTALGVAVSGNYAYVANNNGGLVVVNVANKDSPTIAAVYTGTAGYAYDVAIEGNYAYTAFTRSGLTVVDITNPKSPTTEGIYDVAGFASGVAIVDNYAYVAYGYMGLTVVDITNPASPTLAGSYITTGYAHDIAVAGNYAYIADGNSGLVIADVKNPSSPSLKGSYNPNTGGHAWGIAVSDSYAYLADGSSGLLIVDVTNPASPSLEGGYNTAGNAENVVISGNYAYVADGDNGLVILDITKPSAPVHEGSYDTSGHAYGVNVIGNYAYVADGSEGLVILDITNPATPALVGSYDTNFAQNIAVSGNYAYIADDSNGLVILEITNPAAPTLAGSYDTPGYGYSVAVAGNYAYVADFNNGLVILSVDNGSDVNPPASVTNLNEITAGPSWIRWTWVNPSDADFSHVMVYIDGAFVENAVTGVYELTGLTEGTTHTISTKTVDTSGNTNPTWVNDSAVATTIIPSDTTPPGSVANLGETDSDSDWINWSWTNPEDDDFSYVMVYIDGEFVTNTTDSSVNFYNATELSKGTTYTIGLQTVDTSGNINSVQVNDSATAIKLPKVSNLAGTNITKNSITLLWENSEDTSQVKISRNDMVLGNVSDITSYIDGNLSSGKSYTYTLVPYNDEGVEGKAVTAILRTKSGSSGGGGGGSSSSKSSSGGSGAAASVEDFSNLALKDVANAYLRIDTNVTYEFTKEGNPIQSISFYSLKNSGQITSTVEVLNNRSKLANSTPEGSIYKYVNIWLGKAGFATASNIKDAKIQFKVNSSWIRDMGLNPEDVKLQRYNGTAWEVLPTTLESNTTGYVLYESQTPGFSPFAITAEKELASSPSSETEAQNGSSNDTSVAKGTKAPGFEALFAIAGMIAVAYLIRKR